MPKTKPAKPTKPFVADIYDAHIEAIDREEYVCWTDADGAIVRIAKVDYDSDDELGEEIWWIGSGKPARGAARKLLELHANSRPGTAADWADFVARQTEQ